MTMLPGLAQVDQSLKDPHNQPQTDLGVRQFGVGLGNKASFSDLDPVLGAP